MTEPMKTAEEILRAKFSGLSHKIVTPVHPVQKTLIVAAMQEYADQEKSAERERILSEVRKYVFWHDKFFNDTIVGQPPSLQPLRDLIKDKSHE